MATQRRLTRILRDMVKKKDVTGLQVAVRLPSGETWIGTDGNAEFAPPRPLEEDTIFAIASVSKTFIAALILQLAEEGKLSIDDFVADYVPDAPKARIATIRELLSHTSGIYDYFSNPKYIAASGAWARQRPASGLQDREHHWTYDEILDLVKKGYCEPGTCYRYSNTNYVILGKLAEVVGGAPLHRQLRERFFEPLGLSDTYYQPAEKPPLDAAHGSWRNLDGTRNDHTRDSRVIPFIGAVTAAGAAGAIASTARDLTVWASALYGGDVLTKRSLQEMTTILPMGLYGLGTDVAMFGGHRAYGHRGGLRGYEASMWYFPTSGVSVALLSNQGNWVTDAPMERIVKAVLGKAGA